jgi:Cation transport ATPase
MSQLVFGPISSAFDFLTFAVMLSVFHAHATEFRSGWFVESLATQTLKGAGALEQLANGKVMTFDKTGTLTHGRPVLRDLVVAPDSWDPPAVLAIATARPGVGPRAGRPDRERRP